MPTILFQHQFLDALLRGDKQQTTRKQTDRIKVGDVVHIYIDQRSRIIDKPLRRLTKNGIAMMPMDRYPFPSINPPMHYAHFLGKVEITEVYDMCPCDNSARSAWAKADGFTNFGCADTWFTERYGHEWYQQTWTVIKWNGWAERYFEPKP